MFYYSSRANVDWIAPLLPFLPPTNITTTDTATTRHLSNLSFLSNNNHDEIFCFLFVYIDSLRERVGRTKDVVGCQIQQFGEYHDRVDKSKTRTLCSLDHDD